MVSCLATEDRALAGGVMQETRGQPDGQQRVRPRLSLQFIELGMAEHQRPADRRVEMIMPFGVGEDVIIVPSRMDADAGKRFTVFVDHSAAYGMSRVLRTGCSKQKQRDEGGHVFL